MEEPRDTAALAAQAVMFLLAIWLAGYLFEKLRLSGLVGEIVVGIILGPGGLGLVPEWHGFLLLGKVGIFWLLFDGGAHLDISMLRENGLVSVLVACTGVVAPLAMVWGAMVLVGFTPLESFVMGTALAPTSGGMAVKLMSDAGVLQSKVGQTIVCAAMTDDILSLVILAIVSNLDGGDSGAEKKTSLDLAIEVGLPIFSSLVFISLVYPITKLFPMILNGKPASAVGPAMVITCMSMALGCQFAHSSEYMGSFLAGVCFGNIVVDPEDGPPQEDENPEAADTTNGLVQNVQKTTALETVPEWLEKRSAVVLQGFFVSVFFSSTGFNVPVKLLFKPDTLLLGLFCSVVAVVGKLLSGAWSKSDKWCVGWAMVARGELGFVMATSALATKLIPENGFNVTVWAVLTNTLISPPIFQMLLQDIAAGEQRITDSVQSDQE